jgi:hypothetical protein
MVLRKKKHSKPGGKKEQRSSSRTEEKGNHTGGTQHGPLKFHLLLESAKKMEKEWNKRIRRSQEEMKKVMWCFM